MLTRQAISPVSFLRRHALVAVPIAIIVSCLLLVAAALSGARPEVRASPEFSIRDATSDVRIDERDHGDITTVGSHLSLDAIPAIATPQFVTLESSTLWIQPTNYLGVADGRDYSHAVEVKYDDPSTAWSDSVRVSSGAREVTLYGDYWQCMRVGREWRCARSDL